MVWSDTIYCMIWYDILYDLIYDMVWCDKIYDVIWYDTELYDIYNMINYVVRYMAWYDILCDMKPCNLIHKFNGRSINIIWHKTVTVKNCNIYSNPCISLDGPWGLQEDEFTRMSRQSAHGDGNVSITHRPLLPPKIYPCYSFLLVAELTPGP